MQILRQLRVFGARKWEISGQGLTPECAGCSLGVQSEAVPISHHDLDITQQHLFLVAQPVVPESFS